jgi:uncharacterized membrane protein
MFFPGCLPLIAIFGLLFLLPFFFAHVMLAALTKLGLSPLGAAMVLMGIFIGGSINIPVKRYPREEQYFVDPFMLFGFGRMFPRLRLTRSYTTLAVNVGGCIVPIMVAIYQIFRILAQGPGAFLTLSVAVGLSIAVCYWLARPVAGIGITMPALIPPLTSALPSVVMMPDFAPPIAFTAGVLGPLVGADLLHLRDIKKLSTGIASIGGAGTFDGIVLSGLLAALLA